MAPIQTALIGVGLAGQVFHAPMLLARPDLFTLNTVVERNPKSARGTIGDRFGIDVKIVNRMEDVWSDKSVELVVVATPSHTHYEVVKAALQAGKHVIVDKPVTATYAEALELHTLNKTQRKILYPYQNRRWDSDYLTLRKILDEGHLGTVVDFESHFDRFQPALKGTWKDHPLPGNGLVYDLGAHLIDQALQLFGRPAKLTAFVENVRAAGDNDDAFTIHLHYPTSPNRAHPLKVTLCGHLLTVRSTSSQFRYFVRGTKGSFTKTGTDVQENQLRFEGISVGDKERGYGIEGKEIQGKLEVAGEGGKIESKSIESLPGTYVSLYENLAQCIQTQNSDNQAVKWMESAQVIELIELAHKSAKEGRTLEVPALNV